MGTTSRITQPPNRRTGVLLAAVAAVISGLAIFVNAYGVRAWSGVSDATTYTTIKNLIATLALLAAASVFAANRAHDSRARPSPTRYWPALAVVAVVGGSVPFVLFFEGLARASSAQAAFIHKTLIVWVAILAVGILREKVGALHVGALAVLVNGQLLLSGGTGGMHVGSGEFMIFAATLLWSIEVVVTKRLLVDLSPATLSVARMGGGTILLIVYGLVRGGFVGLSGLSAHHLGWVLLTGIVLAAYVATWHAALAVAPAVDVTAVLVGGAVVTALLRRLATGEPIASPVGLVMVTAGVLITLAASASRAARQPAVEGR